MTKVHLQNMMISLPLNYARLGHDRAVSVHRTSPIVSHTRFRGCGKHRDGRDTHILTSHSAETTGLAVCDNLCVKGIMEKQKQSMTYRFRTANKKTNKTNPSESTLSE